MQSARSGSSSAFSCRPSVSRGSLACAELCWSAAPISKYSARSALGAVARCTLLRMHAASRSGLSAGGAARRIQLLS